MITSTSQAPISQSSLPTDIGAKPFSRATQAAHSARRELFQPVPGDSAESFAAFKRRVESSLVDLERLAASHRGRLSDCSNQDYAGKSLAIWADWVDSTSQLHPDPAMRSEYLKHLGETFYDRCRPSLARKLKPFTRQPTEAAAMKPILELEKKKLRVWGQESRLPASALISKRGAARTAREEFAFYFSDGREQAGDAKARLTINYDSALASKAVDGVRRLYANPAFHGAKVRSPGYEGQAGDNALLYLTDPVADMPSLDRLLSGFPRLKTDDFVPPGTVPTSKPGVGYSEFPDGSSTSSHMASRMPVILDAIARKRADAAVPNRPLQAYLSEALQRAGLDPDRPWARARP